MGKAKPIYFRVFCKCGEPRSGHDEILRGHDCLQFKSDGKHEGKSLARLRRRHLARGRLVRQLLAQIRWFIEAQVKHVAPERLGTCCACGYRGERETTCPGRAGSVHCPHWWDGPEEEGRHVPAIGMDEVKAGGER